MARRVSKADPRVDAYGCVDELEQLRLGHGTRNRASMNLFRAELVSVQKELINVMGELATAREDLPRYTKDGFQLTTAEMVDRADVAHR